MALPKSETRHPARAQAPLHLPHKRFEHDKSLQAPPLVRYFSYLSKVARSPLKRFSEIPR